MSAPLTYTCVVGGDTVCEVRDAALSWGRGRIGQQPSARVLTVSVDDPGGAYARAWQPGIAVTFDIDPGWRRFTGRLSDIPSYDPLGGVTTFYATTDLANLGRTFTGDEPWPVEVDGARAARILSLGGFDTTAVDPGWVPLLGVDVDRQSFLQMLHDTAASAGAVVVDLPNGQIAYQDMYHRAGVPSPWESSYTSVAAEHPSYSDIHTDSGGDTITHADYLDLWRYPHPHAAGGGVVLDACDLDGEVTWSRTTEGLVNRVVIRYGDPEQVYETADTSSIGVHGGEYSVSLSTLIVDSADATTYGQTILQRRASQRWALVPLRLVVSGITPTAEQVLGLLPGDTFQVVGMSPDQIVEQVQLVVEGARETYTADRLTIELSTSDFTTVWDTEYDDLLGSLYDDLKAAHPDYRHLLTYGGT